MPLVYSSKNRILTKILKRVKLTIISRGYEAEKKGVSFDRIKMNKALAAYDIAWVEWQDPAKDNSDCPSLYKVTSKFFNVEVGMKSSVDKYRN